jgi:hypothetical protein
MYNKEGIIEDILLLFYTIPTVFLSLFFILDSSKFPDYLRSDNFLLISFFLLFTFYIIVFKNTNILTLDNKVKTTAKEGIKEDLLNFITFNIFLAPCLYFYNFDYHFLYLHLGGITLYFLIAFLTVFLLVFFVQHNFIKLFSLTIFKGFMSVDKTTFYFPEKSALVTRVYFMNNKTAYYINNKHYSEKEIKKDGYTSEYLYKLMCINRRFPLTIKKIKEIKNKSAGFYSYLNNYFFLKSIEEISLQLENKEFFDQYQDELYIAILEQDKNAVTNLIEKDFDLPYRMNLRILSGAVYLACFTKNMDIIKYLTEDKKIQNQLTYINKLQDILIEDKLINTEIMCLFLKNNQYYPQDKLFDLLDLNNDEHFKILTSANREPYGYNLILNYIMDRGNIKQLKQALNYLKLEEINYLCFNIYSLYEKQQHDKLEFLYNNPKLEKTIMNLEKEERENIEKYLINNKIKHF